MRPTASTWMVVATAVVVPAWLLLFPAIASAQHTPHSGDGGSGAASSGGGSSSGGSGGSGSSSSGSSGGSSGGGSSASSGGSSGGGAAVPRGSFGSGSTSRATGKDSSSTGQATQVSNTSSSGAHHTRDGQPILGTAVPRGSAPIGTGGGSIIFVPGGYGFYPWAYGGLGFGGFYGGYYGGYFDPWYPDGIGYSPTYYYPRADDDDGALRIKVKPREASVYVDGYYVGRVDDFDGLLQKLHLSRGPHRIEIREQGYEPLAFDVRIRRDETLTYHGELKKIQ